MASILIMLSLVIVMTDTVRLSLMEWKAALLWSLVWMAVAYGSTMWLTRLSMAEIYEYLNIRTICLLGFIENIIFILYVFYAGKGKAILSCYPGLMLIFPVTVMSFWMSRIVNGVSFVAIGTLASLATGVLLIGSTFFLQWLRCEKSWLYAASVSSVISYIFIFGIS